MRGSDLTRDKPFRTSVTDNPEKLYLDNEIHVICDLSGNTRPDPYNVNLTQRSQLNVKSFSPFSYKSPTDTLIDFLQTWNHSKLKMIKNYYD